MYATCMFCSSPLGRNDALEHFPVGRRLAFDGEKGRLWVICPSCARWNLTPLEERWEALEEAERLFRSSHLRQSTEQIGLARVADGTDLIRIGSPIRPEMAAWRYGPLFVKRRRRNLMIGAAMATGGIVAVTGGVVAGAVGLVMTWRLASYLWKSVERGHPASTIARIRDRRGNLITVQRQHLRTTRILTGADGAFALDVEHGIRNTRFEGADARRAAAALFPAVNRLGGTNAEVQSAVERLERAGSAEQFLADVGRRGRKLTRAVPDTERLAVADPESVKWDSGLLALSTTLGLAIEMALHESQERLALDSELEQLEQAWKDAEEIGSIADSLLMPESVERALASLRRRTS